MKTKILLLFLVFASIVGYGQQDAQFTQYMYNTIVVNPAYAGSRPSMSIFALHRNQWVGFSGAPVTNTFSVHTPFNETNVGLGLSVVNERIGVTNTNNIGVDFSYSIRVMEDYKLSFGVKGSASLFSADYSRLDQQEGDRVFENIDSKFSPNVGVGFYLHSDKSYIGLSAPYLIKTDYYGNDPTTNKVASSKIYYYLIMGHVFDLNPNLKLKPALLTKCVPGAPLQVDVSANFLMNRKFVAGLAYRWSAALSAMVGFQIDDSWFIGYAYDLDTTSVGNYNSGSHELFLRYELFNKYDKIVSPRFF